MTHVSLFSGMGGMDLAAEWAGFETVAVCEIDPGCRKVLARHFPKAKQFCDIREITNGSIESPTLVSAGFPCQPFSVAGSRQGASDERHLWPEVVRVLGFLKPKWFLGENVRGLLSISEGRVFGSILSDLAHLGYRVGWGCYGADEACGASHRRDRVFIVGYMPDADRRGVWRRGIFGVFPCPETETQGSKEEWERSGDAINDSGGPMAHAKSLGRAEGIGIACRTTEGLSGLENDCLSVVHSASVRREGRGAEDANQVSRMQDTGERYSPFPPGPADLEAWSRILRDRPDLAPALTAEEEAELSVRPVADGIPRRVALKMLGNAVVPAQVYPILKEIADYENEV